MAPRTTYANLADGLQPFSLWDQSLADMGSLGITPCTAVGANAIVLTPIASVFAPNVTTPQALQEFSFVAAANSTSSVTIQVGTLAAKPLYRMDGVTQATTGDLTAAVTYLVNYNAALNSAAGGFQLLAPISFLISPNITGTLTVTSASSSALAVGPTGATNSAFNVDASVPSLAAGLNVVGAVTGGTVAIRPTDPGANTNLSINAKGTGTIGIGSVSTGAVTIPPKVGIGSAAGALTPTNTSLVVSQNVTAVDAATPGLTPVLHVVGVDGAASAIILDSFGNFPSFGFRRANGTAALPTVAINGSTLGSFFGLGYDASGSKYGYCGEIDFFATETWSNTAHGGGIKFWSVANTTTTQVNSMTLQQSGGLSVGTSTDPGIGGILANTAIKSQGATAGIGYATGAGGTVTQATSKATGVTLNTVTGIITMNAAALAAATIVSFVLTDSAIAATDYIGAAHESGGTTGGYTINARATGAGTAAFDIRNNTAGSLSEAIVIRFFVHKSVNA